MQRFDDALDAVDWLFATWVCGKVFNHIVSAAKAGEHMVRIQEIAQTDGSASDLADAWQSFQACMGPPLCKAIFDSGEWREMCPTPRGAPAAPPMDDVLTIWTNTKGQRVVAQDKDSHFLFVVE
jgi:hypothetical protein